MKNISSYDVYNLQEKPKVFAFSLPFSFGGENKRSEAKFPTLAETFLPIECNLGLKGCRQQIFPI